MESHSLYTAVSIYEFTGLRLINYVSICRYISHNLYAKRVPEEGESVRSAATIIFKIFHVSP